MAARQHGAIAHWQLRELGLGAGAIKHRVKAGRLHRIHLGVYAVGTPLRASRGRVMAAVLACGPSSVTSHQTAADLLGFRRSASPTIHVTSPARGRRSRDGIRLHSARGLAREDRTVGDGIPVTSVARTLLDLAGVLRPRQLERALEETERLRIFDLTAIEDLCDRSRGHRGRRPLIALLGTASAVPPHTKSDLERMFLDLCSDAGLPPPLVNAVVEGYEVDAHWPGTSLIVELDSWRFHRTRGAFERDRARDLRLKLGEYTVLRLTYRQLTQDRAAVTATLRSLLDSARTLRAPDPGAPARG